MGARHAIQFATAAVATLLIASALGSGCVLGRYSEFVFPLQISGSVVDGTDGTALSGVSVSFECESIPYPKEPLVGWSTNGTIDIEYLLAFGRKQHRGLRGYESPGDKCQLVLTREGYIPTEFEFKLNELEGDCEYPIDLGRVALTPLSP